MTFSLEMTSPIYLKPIHLNFLIPTNSSPQKSQKLTKKTAAGIYNTVLSASTIFPDIKRNNSNQSSNNKAEPNPKPTKYYTKRMHILPQYDLCAFEMHTFSVLHENK